MKIYIRTLLILVLEIIIIACEAKTVIKPVKTIDLRNTYKEEYDVKLSEIATDIDYIVLETKESSLISNIGNPRYNVIFSMKHILIKDGGANILFLFKKNGDFIKKIGTIGKGPGEYIRISDMAIIPASKIIVINDRILRKTLIYNFEGDFLRAIPLDFFQNTVMGFHGNLLFRNAVDYRMYSDHYTFSAYNTDGKLLKKIMYKEKEKETKGIETYLGGVVHSNFILKDSLVYWEKNGFHKKDTVWSISKNYKVTPRYVIDLGGERISLDRMKSPKRLTWEEQIKWNVLLEYLESDKYIFYDIMYKNDYAREFTTKPEMISKRVSDVDNTKKYISGKFLNDIDGGLCFWPQGKVSENKVYMMVYGSDIKDYIEKQGDDYQALNPEAREKLLDIVKTSKVTDNPILMVVTLKE